MKNVVVFFLTMLVFVLLAMLGVQCYDHASDPAYVAVFKGVYANEPGRLSNNDGQWIGLHYLIHALYTISTDVDWYGFFILLFCTLIVFLLLQIILRARKQGNYPFVILLLLSIVSLENLVLLEFTRIAFMLATTGLALVIYHIKAGSGTVVNRTAVALGLVAFILGCLVRHQAGILSFILLLPVAFIYLVAHYTTIVSVARAFVIPVIFLGALLVFVGIRWDESWDKTPEYGGYMISLWDVDFPKDQLSLNTEADSLIYKIVTGIQFTNDPKHINPDFFRKIGVPYTDKKIQSASTIVSNKVNYRQKFTYVGVGYIMKHPGWSLLLVMVALIAVISWRGNARMQVVVLLLFAGYVLLYFLIAVLLKMEERIFCPFVFSCALGLALLINARKEERINQTNMSMLFLLVVLAVLEGVFIYGRYTARKNEAAYILTVLDMLRSRPEKNVFVDRISDQIYLWPLQKDPLDKRKVYPTLDNYFFFLLPTYNQKMEDITGGTSVIDYVNFAADHSNDCVFVSNSERLTEVLSYFNFMYGTDFKCKAVIPDLRSYHKGNTERLEPLGFYKIVR
jgi:hypothetical protein